MSMADTLRAFCNSSGVVCSGRGQCVNGTCVCTNLFEPSTECAATFFASWGDSIYIISWVRSPARPASPPALEPINLTSPFVVPLFPLCPKMETFTKSRHPPLRPYRSRNSHFFCLARREQTVDSGIQVLPPLIAGVNTLSIRGALSILAHNPKLFQVTIACFAILGVFSIVDLIPDFKRVGFQRVRDSMRPFHAS